MPDPYRILGVPRDADRHTIQVAYRRLARRHHPDFGGDPQIMAVLNEAWSVLGDASRRETYDSTRPRRTIRAETIVTPEPAGPLAAAAERRYKPDAHGVQRPPWTSVATPVGRSAHSLSRTRTTSNG
jgi:molecular chaperone DnaJ